MPIIVGLSDYIAVVTAENLSYMMRKFWLPIANPAFHIPFIYLFVIVPTIFLCFLHINSRTKLRSTPLWKVAQNVFSACFYAILLILMLMYFAKVSEVVSRLFVGLTWLFSFVFIVFLRYGIKKYLDKYGLLQIPVLFVGAGHTAELVIKSFDSGFGLGYKVIGFIDDHPVSVALTERFKILGGFGDIERVIKATGVRSVIITAPGLSPVEQVNLVNRIQPLVRSVSFVPDFMGAPVTTMDVESLFDERIIFLKVRNNLAQWQNRMIKRIFDLVCGIMGLVVVVPAAIVIGVLIKLDSKGPVFFTHRRIGQNGKEFNCYKFRSMFVDGDRILDEYLKKSSEAKKEWEEFAKLKDDPRVTPMGRIIRRYSLDELPQMFNVIKGDMSLVGPRPYMPREKEMMGEYLSIITTTVPGITGLWQTSGRNEINFSDRLKLDEWYVRNWSMWMDLMFLLKTAVVVLKSKGAY